MAAQQAQAQLAAENSARTTLLNADGGVALGNVPPGNPYAAAAISFAHSKLGVPYTWGGTGPNTFDCSGLVQWAYRQAGLSLARVAADQWRSGPEVPLAQLAPGDLLFWATDPADKATIHHVALYIGDGQMIEAPHTGAFVRQVPIRLGPEFAGAVRPGVTTVTTPTA
jgi:cell wall-associated NlpC family hydrolase